MGVSLLHLLIRVQNDKYSESKSKNRVVTEEKLNEQKKAVILVFTSVRDRWGVRDLNP